MASPSLPTILDSASPFLKFCTEITRGTLMSLLRLVAHTHHLTSVEAVHAYFDGTNEAEKTVGFKQLVNTYFQRCCDEYTNTHQQVTDGRKQLSDLNENNLDEYVYCVIQKIMLQNDGYRHLNCIFDSAMIVCVIQFKYVLISLANSPIQMASSRISRGGLFPDAEATILRHIFDQHLNAANEKLRLNNDQYKNLRSTCDENSACGLNFANEKQRQKQLREAIDLEGQSLCPDHR